ncbi:MAG: polysaccharide deacetylase family protein [Acidobacteriota bacterium]|nr:polysaccharide deacetylase family protein [Acidobacteriota bacterium]
MHGKKERVAKVSAGTGLTRLLEAIPPRPSLLILNYHRIGDRTKTPYDSGTFSATTAEFDWQVRHIMRSHRIVNLEEAKEIVQGRATPRDAAVLLTFDDGYRDNFEEAFPVLQRHGVSATFFLPTAFVGTGRLPWWDVIAYLIKNAKPERIALTYPEPAEFDLTSANRPRATVQILRQFKKPAASDAERFLGELETACDTPRPGTAAERCFLNWDEAREMQAEGMCFGSHTHTHPILAKLGYGSQLEELRTSREIIEGELRRPGDTLAYPVGQRDSFSADSVKALKEAGYSAAFSFYGGVNKPGSIAPYNVLRGGVDDESRAIFRLRLALESATGRALL